MARNRVTVVGAGHVGATTAQRIADAELADVVLIDIIEGVPQGKGLDMLEACPISGSDVQIKGTNDYRDTKDSDIVVITAGLPRKPGMSRDDLLQKNYDIVKSVTEEVAKYSPNAMLIVISNPLDAMVQTAYKVSGFPKNRVMGMAGILDSARMRAFVAMELKVSVDNIHAFVLGGHGDSMVPLPRYTTVSGIPLPELLSQERIDAIVDRTRKGGGEIVAYLKTGSAYYAPSAASVEMVDAILKDKKKILPVAAYLEGEYGINGLYMGVPAKLGAGGVEEVIEISLTNEERTALQKSAASVQELVGIIGV
jgi:malate dehydrogenase